MVTAAHRLQDLDMDQRPLWASPVPAGVALLMATGAVLIGVSAWIHLHLWHLGYRSVHVIGPLFLAQAIAGFCIGALIIALRRWPMAAIGALYLAGTMGGLLVSDWFGLFGFHDHLDAPYAGMSLAIEGTGLVVLLAATAASLLPGLRRRR